MTFFSTTFAASLYWYSNASQTSVSTSHSIPFSSRTFTISSASSDTTPMVPLTQPFFLIFRINITCAPTFRTSSSSAASLHLEQSPEYAAIYVNEGASISANLLSFISAASSLLVVRVIRKLSSMPTRSSSTTRVLSLAISDC